MADESAQPACGNHDCAASAGTSTLYRCGRCRNAIYCSRECQTASWPSHKSKCKRQNYIIEFHLCPGVITDPPVIRTLSCPAKATLVQLHQALQIAFQWVGIHCYDFTVDDPVQHIPPPQHDWLSELVPESMRWFHDWMGASELMQRRHLLRVACPTAASSIHRIDATLERLRVQPTTARKRADKVKLFQFLEDERYKGQKMCYNYDFRADWKHVMTVVGRAAATDDFKCISGEGHYVGEDSPGPLGWQDLKACYRATPPDDDQKDKIWWYEHDCFNGEAQGLRGREHEFDKSLADRRLAEIRMG